MSADTVAKICRPRQASREVTIIGDRIVGMAEITVPAELYDFVSKALINAGYGHRVGIGPIDLTDIAISRGALAGIDRPNKQRRRHRSGRRKCVAI